MRAVSMWFIWKKAIKSFLRNKNKTFPILILMTFAIGFSATLFDMQDIRSEALEETLELTDFADGFIYFDQIPIDYAQNLTNSEINNYFDGYEMRMLLVVKYEINDQEYDGLLVGIDTTRDDHINALIDNNKEQIDKDDYYNVLNWNFADANEIEEDDELEVNFGSIKEDLEVKSVGYNPEFNYVPIYKDVAFPSLRPYPILYIDNKYLNQRFLNQSVPLVNQILYKLDDMSDQEDLENSIKESMGDFLEEIFPQKEHPYFESMREDEENDRTLITIITIILLLGSIITLILVIHKLIGEDLKSVSIFQGLGANNFEILSSYLIFNLILSGLAIVMGLVLSFFLNFPVNVLMTEAIGIPFLPETGVSFLNVLIIGGVFFGITTLSTYLIVKKSFKMDVQQTLKYETKFLEKGNFFEKVYKKLKKNPTPFAKYNLRRIFGRKMQLMGLLISLSISASFLIISFSFNDSV
ncbi:MAG: FtsX-like permease family protein, partial [Candidatus Lokiarchaeota archaeon]|nr:FtsX-like permease family protein [Candidatus Lokiarchaeota archaeon]